MHTDESHFFKQLNELLMNITCVNIIVLQFTSSDYFISFIFPNKINYSLALNVKKTKKNINEESDLPIYNNRLLSDYYMINNCHMNNIYNYLPKGNCKTRFLK